jgi:hypothetical protein
MKAIGLVIFGVILGVLASFVLRPTPVQAQSRWGGTVRQLDIGANPDIDMESKAVLGFSCTTTAGGRPQCFLATH